MDMTRGDLGQAKVVHGIVSSMMLPPSERTNHWREDEARQIVEMLAPGAYVEFDTENTHPGYRCWIICIPLSQHSMKMADFPHGISSGTRWQNRCPKERVFEGDRYMSYREFKWVGIAIDNLAKFWNNDFCFTTLQEFVAFAKTPAS